ncbi:phospholipase [Planctomycetaceae bacterium SCGC AG-212-D15]|nr:phospholipase [Planctomycetaceae bacterium SCGC AG-212-D15]
MKPLLALAVSLALTHAVLAQETKPALEKKTFTDAKGEKLPYRLLVPENYDAKQKYPLVIFLHGAGERGTDNEKQLVHGVPEFTRPENRKKYPCFLVAPQCPDEEKWGDWTVKEGLPEKPTEPGRLVLELIDALQKEYSIDSKRLYLTGLSMGGFGTWDLISRHPEKFAAAVPICGGGDPKQAPKLVKVPIWAFHGGKDNAVKVERTREMIVAIDKAGGHPRYTEYYHEGHGSWVPAYKDGEMLKWMFEQKLK